MIIYLILLYLVGTEANILNNDLFSAKFNSDKILLNTDSYGYNKLKISYGYLVEHNTNKSTQIDFNYIYKDTDYSMNFVKTACSSNLVNIDIMNKMFTNNSYEKNDYANIIKFTTNKLYITIKINTWMNRSKNNDLVLDLNFDNDIYSKNNIDFTSGNYIINFPKTCNVDSYKEEVFIDKYTNKLHIHFPYHKDYILYTYSITKLNLGFNLGFNLMFYLLLVTIICAICILYYKHKQKQNNQYDNYNYNYKYKYY